MGVQTIGDRHRLRQSIKSRLSQGDSHIENETESGCNFRKNSGTNNTSLRSNSLLREDVYYFDRLQVKLVIKTVGQKENA